ncbi:uncharacterized protein LOC128987903 isoform X2 [Macrosteles quadrilineatus]|uniref:uncharacterized protein LOC128987903 isoform X2 n=1 Tax=Macrosteles quadrilineatus TaxID=74068 RepID=UPI0023E2BAD6|nr:uncharacterized protein LOC128987903 isoform X2 [Macrosteles quadrilineatus]
MGPYNVVLESVKDCAEKGTGEITVTAKARTDESGKIVHTGYLKLPFGLTDKLKAQGDASILTDGKWTPIGLIWKLGLPKGCSSIKTMTPIWFQMLKSANIQNPECPIPKGTYHFIDYHVKGKIAKMDSMRFGKYRVRLSFSKNSQKIGCLHYVASIVPK